MLATQEIYERFRDEFRISTDRGLLDIDLIWRFLSDEAYWSKGIKRSRIERAIRHSICFGLYQGKKQIGFSRVITDHSILAYVLDMFIIEEYRGKGHGSWMIQCMLEHPDLKRVRRWMLRTHQQHELFHKFGFEVFGEPQTIMSRIQDDRGYEPPEVNSES
ncbi:MAG: GNAT family N-acetyltransferase [bacterium]